jgi:hypothetical protein
LPQKKESTGTGSSRQTATFASLYTTGETEAHYLNGDPRIGTGENFTCGAWTTEDGPGKLAGAT